MNEKRKTREIIQNFNISKYREKIETSDDQKKCSRKIPKTNLKLNNSNKNLADNSKSKQKC